MQDNFIGYVKTGFKTKQQKKHKKQQQHDDNTFTSKSHRQV